MLCKCVLCTQSNEKCFPSKMLLLAYRSYMDNVNTIHQHILFFIIRLKFIAKNAIFKICHVLALTAKTFHDSYLLARKNIFITIINTIYDRDGNGNGNGYDKNQSLVMYRHTSTIQNAHQIFC